MIIVQHMRSGDEATLFREDLALPVAPPCPTIVSPGKQVVSLIDWGGNKV